MDIIQRAGEDVPWEGRWKAGQSLQMGEGEKDEGREAGVSLGDPDSALMRDRWGSYSGAWWFPFHCIYLGESWHQWKTASLVLIESGRLKREVQFHSGEKDNPFRRSELGSRGQLWRPVNSSLPQQTPKQGTASGNRHSDDTSLFIFLPSCLHPTEGLSKHLIFPKTRKLLGPRSEVRWFYHSISVYWGPVSSKHVPITKRSNSEKKYFRGLIHRKTQTSNGFETIAFMERGTSVGETTLTLTDGLLLRKAGIPAGLINKASQLIVSLAWTAWLEASFCHYQLCALGHGP